MAVTISGQKLLYHGANKTEIEALIGVPTGSDAITEDGFKGWYDGLSWQWFAVGGGSIAFTDLADTFPAYTGLGDEFVKVKADESGLETGTPAGGGDVLGPATSVNNHLAVWDGTNNKTLKDGGVLPAGASSMFPQDVIAFAQQFKVAVGTTVIAFSVNTSQPFCFYANTNTNEALNDAIEAAVMLKAGVYDVYVLAITATTRGIVKWSCDGSDFITNQDWYSGSTVYNVIKTGTLTVAADGRHLIRCTVTGKNGSAASPYYRIPLTAIWFVAQTLSSETQ